MNRGALLLLVVGAVFAAGTIYMLNVEFDTGSVYPELSTLRTDQRGARLLFDSLAQIPGVTVARNYAPLENLEGSRSSIILLGLPHSFGSPDDLKLFELLSKHGSRIIAGFGALEGSKLPPPLASQWGVELGTESDLKRTRGQYFRKANGWQPIEVEDQKPIAVQRRFGDGVIVLLAASEDFTNESSVRMNRLESISTLLGEPTRIIFDEAHLGIAESGSVVGLARRFRLSGMAFGLALCAALFIWRNATAFPPPAPSQSRSSFSGRTSRAGLLTLLHRHIPRSALLSTCWREWLSTNRRSVPQRRLDQAAGIVDHPPSDPLQAVREIQTILRGRESAQ